MIAKSNTKTRIIKEKWGAKVLIIFTFPLTYSIFFQLSAYYLA
jgi:hypothetical protein